MRIVFYSNFLNHHQLPFCLEMGRITDGKFIFVATEKIPEDKIQLGYRDMDSQYAFVLKAYDKENEEAAFALARECDVAIFGQAPEKYLEERMRLQKLSFRYSERVYKKGTWRVISPRGLHAMISHHTVYRKNELYLLCASAYTAYDYHLVGAYPNKAFKWGYFPEIKDIDIDDLIIRKRENRKIRLIWVARFIKLKHPETVIWLAEKLMNNGYDFELIMIGIGEMERKISSLIRKKGLENHVHMLGSMPPENVRIEMEKSDIFLFTSDFNEGWGAVLNESMNSACAVIASHAIGSVPFLLKDGENGFIYKNGDNQDLYNKVIRLIRDTQLREQMGRNAYATLTNLWNSKVAAERLVNLSQTLISHQQTDIYKDGPCSRAAIIRNNWIQREKK